MEMKYYNPSNNFSAPIPREPKPYTPPRQKVPEVVIPKVPERREEAPKEEISERHSEFEQGLSLNMDDIIILGLILVLLANGCEDYLLLAVLGYLLLSGKKSAEIM
ncbi:MAG: hypothetical protein E7414_05315 [Ruminococcaceae bacterium]|nr:hypothetical protein [Oscillospiraceae bacterium]